MSGGGETPFDDMEAAAGGRSGIQALDTALSVLGILAAQPGAVSLTDLARLAGMPPSKVHRYLASFAKAGLVQQTQRSGRYDLGKAAADLGLAAIARMDFIGRAADCLEELVDATGAAGLIAIWGPLGPTVVRWQRTGSFVITALGLGTTFPLLNSATGRIFLAFSPRRVVARQLNAEIERARSLALRWPDIDPNNDIDIETLITKTKALGYASVDGRFIPGLNAISAPLLNWQGEAEAAMTLTAGDPQLLDADGPALRLLLNASRSICPQVPSSKLGPDGGRTGRPPEGRKKSRAPRQQ